MTERPEIGEILSGLDPPRSLPESLRQRLEDELTTGAAAPARPLEPQLDDRLAAALGNREDQDMVMLLSGIDGPRPVPAGLSARLRDHRGDQLAPRRRRRAAALVRTAVWSPIGAGAAAVCLLVAAVTGIAVSSHNTSRPAATARSSTTAASASHPGLAGGGTDALGAASGSGSGVSGSSGKVFNSAEAVPTAGEPTAGATGSGAGSSTAGSQTAMAPAPPTTAPPVLGPKVTSVVPASGPATGGTSVTIRGLRFDGATSVRFDTMAALNFVVTSSGEIVAIAPPHLPGFVNVTVTTSHGTSAVTTGDRYDYTT